MRFRTIGQIFMFLSVGILIGVALLKFVSAADHNDPNAVNSIFSDIDVSAADLYDIFGWPSDDSVGGEKVVIALTFASTPKTGVFDTDMLYRILIAPTPRDAPQLKDDDGLEVVLKYFEAIKSKYISLKPAEVRVTVDKEGRAKINFMGFPSGAFVKVIDANTVTTIDTPGGSPLKAYIGGRDDAFFNDLPGFFRSINYAPQFYHVPHTMKDKRELPIPKTLIELDGNKLFNFDPANPKHGQGVKLDLPSGPLTWSGTKYFKDKNGNYRFVYSGKDAQAGRNVNAIILEMPLAFLTQSPDRDRIVNVWGESWVLKAASKIETIPDDRRPVKGPVLLQYPWLVGGVAIVLGALLLLWGLQRGLRSSWIHFSLGVLLMVLGVGYGIIVGQFAAQKPELVRSESELDDELKKYKLVDTDGQAFADAGLSEREDDRQLGAFNFWLAPHFITRLAHLGWGFGPSITALGLKTSFDHDNSPISVHKTYDSAVEAFPRVKKVVLQQLNMPDNSWNKKGLNIPLRRAIEIFVPNVNAIDMDTTGSWPFGRRPEDQVATRFLALFLDMKAEINGKPYNLETLGDQSLWDHAPIEPKTPPNPLKNDKEFLKQFPYLAEPW
ncbi:MAG TPA: DUF4331 family protein [Candidatus Binatia bacterium]